MSVQVPWRRFFSAIFAISELDASWTARLIGSEFLRPRFAELLHRSDSREHQPKIVQEEEKLRRETGLRKEDEAKAHVRKFREKHANAISLSSEVLNNRAYQILARYITVAVSP